MGKVGSEVLYYCSSCKLDLAHVLVSELKGKPSKVECKTCKKTHKYSAPKGAVDGQVAVKEKKVREKKADAKKTSTKSVAAEWAELMSTKDASTAKAYSVKNEYVVGDIVKHPVFGNGIVRKIVFPNKMEIIFEEDVKLLIHSPKR